MILVAEVRGDPAALILYRAGQLVRLVEDLIARALGPGRRRIQAPGAIAKAHVVEAPAAVVCVLRMKHAVLGVIRPGGREAEVPKDRHSDTEPVTGSPALYVICIAALEKSAAVGHRVPFRRCREDTSR